MAGLLRDADISLLKMVGGRYANEGKIVQVTLISKKPYSDLDAYLEELGSNLMTTFTEILYSKDGIRFFVTIDVSFIHPTDDQRNRRQTSFPVANSSFQVHSASSSPLLIHQHPS